MRTAARPTLYTTLLLLVIGCSPSSERRAPPVPENQPPEILEIRVDPSRIHRGVEGHVTGVVQDPDVGDFIIYRWSAARGTFPLDRVRFRVPYKTPSTGDADTVTLLVADAEDTTTMSRVVRMATFEAPRNINVVPGPSWVEVTWTPTIDEGLFDFIGYSVYGANRTLNGLSESELEEFLQNRDPTPSSNLTVTGLDDSEIYNFKVRAVRAVEKSSLTPQRETSPRPQGIEGQMREIGYEFSEPRGFDFSDGPDHLVTFDPKSPADVGRIDFYLGTSDPDEGQGPLVIKSPEMLASWNPIWLERQVGFKPVGRDWSVGTTDTTGFGSSIAVSDSLVVAVRLPEGNFAKIQVTAVEGQSHPFRWIQFRWAYQNLPDYANF